MHKELSMSAEEKERAAVREKEKGNEAFRAGDYQEAMDYYSRSIKLGPSAAAYNNRAIAGIKLEDFSEALADCDKVLELEPANTKAIFRRATAHTGLKQYGEAAADLEHLLSIDPNNKKAQEQLNKLRKKGHLGGATGTKGSGKKKKGHRIQILEVDGSESEEEKSPKQQRVPKTGKSTFQQDTAKKGTEGQRSKVDSSSDSVEESIDAVKQGGSTVTDSNRHTPTPKPQSHNSDHVMTSDKTPEGVASPPTAANDTTTPSPEQKQSASPPPEQKRKPPPPPPSLPPNVQKLKDEGNTLFRAGNYTEATQQYTKAFQLLQKAGKEHEPNMATLLNNRAACHLKNGNSRGCIDDCTHSISLMPVNLKALMRRAAAYETLEKYKQAYNDYQFALRIDGTVERAYSACHRIIPLLQDQHGHDWRSKLPPHPDAEHIISALSSTVPPPLPPTSTETPTTGEASSQLTPSKTEPQSQNRGKFGGTESVKLKTDSGTTKSAESTSQEREREAKAKQEKERNAVQEKERNTVQEKFEKYKTRGNEHVKKGEYAEALSCYRECIRMCPARAVAYTNRALCHLKLNHPFDAELDCSMALELEPANLKALYRRGLARKALERYREAVKDLKAALDIESDNKTVSKELQEVKQLWERQLREMQTKQQQEKTPKKTTAKVPPKSKDKKPSPGQKAPKESKPAQREAKRFPGQPSSSKKSPPSGPLGKGQQASSTQTTVESLLTGSSRSDANGEGESLLTASKTTHFKEKEKGQPSTDSKNSRVRRKKIIIEEGEGSSEEGEDLGAVEEQVKTKPSEARKQAKLPPKANKQAKLPSKASKQAKPPPEASKEVKSPPDTSEQEKPPSEVKPSEASEQVKPSEASEQVKPSEASEQVKPSEASEQVKPSEASEQVKPSEASEQVKPSEASEQVKPSEASEQVKPSEASEQVKPSEASEQVKPSEASEQVKPSEASEQMKSPPDASRQDETRKEHFEAKPTHVQETSRPVQRAAKGTREKLASPYEFVQKWNAIPRTAPSLDYANLLEQIPPSTLPEVITNKLDGIMLTNIIRAIDKQFVPKGKYQLSFSILQNLTKVPRFGMIAMFLSPKEKKDLENVFSTLAKQKDFATAAGNLSQLKKAYGVTT